MSVTLEAMPTTLLNTNWTLLPAPPSWVTSTDELTGDIYRWSEFMPGNPITYRLRGRKRQPQPKRGSGHCRTN